MYRTKRTLFLTTLISILFNFFYSASIAQDSTRFLALDAAITATTNNNRAVQLASLDENIAAAKYKQTDAIYLPQLGISYTAFSTNNPLHAFGFKLQQKNITQNDFNPALLNKPGASPDFTTKLELQQPIINMDLVYQRKAAAKQIEIYKYKTRRSKEFLTYEVQKAYLQLQLAYDAKKLLEEALQTAKSVYTFTNDHYLQGLIQKSDVLNAQVQVTTVETRLAKTNSNIRNASDYLSLLMAIPAGTVYTVENSDTIPFTEKDMPTKIDSSRSDFAAMQKGLEASALMMKAGKKKYLPKLNAFASYQLNDKKPLGFGANAYLAGVQLTWNIFTGNSTKNAIATQNWEHHKMEWELKQQLEQNQLELTKAYRDLSDAQFDIQQQKLAIEQAKEALQILQNRYNQGLVNTTDVLQASTQYSQQKFALAQALFNANITKAYIQFLTSTTTK